jgi:hypothetical protein
LGEALKVDNSRDSNSEVFKWAYYKVVLHSKVIGNYNLRVHVSKSFKAGEAGKPATVDVYPILAAGKIAYQRGYIAVKKADRLAVGEPIMKKLLPGDPSSSRDIPNSSYRKGASLAFKYTEVPYSLSLPVVTQKEGSVFTTIADSVIVEQVVARDGLLNTRCMFLLATSQGDRLPVTLPEGAELTAVLLDGQEIQVEQGMNPQERIVRLRPSAGEITRSVLELAYTVKDASAGRLVAASLPDEIPVQQTLWRVWLPNEWYLLGHDRMFSKLDHGYDDQMINIYRSKHGANVGFKLAGQGSRVTFSRLGAADSLSLVTMGKETFTVAVWVAIVLAGLVMCGLSGYVRVVLVVTAGLGLGVLNLFMPLMVERICFTGGYAVFLVCFLWFGHWVFKKLPQVFKRGKSRKKPLVESKECLEKVAGNAADAADEVVGAELIDDDGDGDGSDDDDNGDDDETHSVDVVNEARRSAKAARDKLAKKVKGSKKAKDSKKDSTDDKEGGR